MQAMMVIVLSFFAIFLIALILANQGIKIFNLGLPGVIENYFVMGFCLISLIKATIEIHLA